MFKRLLASKFKSGFRPHFSLPALVSQCAVCLSWPAAEVCTACVARFSSLSSRCTGCALDLPPRLYASPDSSATGTGTGSSDRCASCVRHPPPVDATLTAVAYAYPWSDLVTRYKFGDRPGWAPFFASLLLQAPGVRAAFEALQVGDLIIPLPLSTERLQSRGFNQAWELSRVLARLSASRARPDAHLLLRIRHTRPQTELSRASRLTNLQGAFLVEPLRATLLAGRRVILVDDVMTSGASLFTAAQVLRLAGAAHITALAFARTAAP